MGTLPFYSRRACVVLAALAVSAGCAPEPAPPAETPAPAPQPAATETRTAPPQAVAREAQVKSLATDAAEIRYRVYGSGEPAIVFIHCWSCDSGYWDAQLNEFAQRYTVVTLDLAGHGQSEPTSRKDWSMANFGADVAAVVGAVGAPRVILVGSSMGGPVALEAARRLPGRVIGIVAVDTLREIAAPPDPAQYTPMLESLRADFAATTADYVAQNLFAESADPVLKQWIVDDMSSAPPAVAIPAIVGLTQMDYTAALDALDVPVTALNATLPPTDEAAIRGKEPRFRVQTLDGVGHFPMLERPVEFNAILDRILAEWKAP